MSGTPQRKSDKPILSKQEFDAAFDRMIPRDLREPKPPGPPPTKAVDEPLVSTLPPVAEVATAVASCASEPSESRPLPESEGFSSLYAELKIQEGGAKATKLLGYATGLQAFDDAIGGLRPGSVTVIAGPKGSGKTALAKQLLDETIALEPLLLGFYFTLTDSPTLLRLKTLARLSRQGGEPLSLVQLSRGEIPSGTVERVASLLKTSTWVKRVYVMNCERGADPQSLIQSIRRELTETRTRGAIAVVDDLPHLAERRGKTSSEEALGQLVQELARVAAKSDLHIIALFPLDQPADEGALNEVLAELGSVVWNASTVIVLPSEGSASPALVIKDRFGKTPRTVDIHLHRDHSYFESTGAQPQDKKSPLETIAARLPPSTVTVERKRSGKPTSAEPTPDSAPTPTEERLPRTGPVAIPAHLLEVLETGGKSVIGSISPGK